MTNVTNTPGHRNRHTGSATNTAAAVPASPTAPAVPASATVPASPPANVFESTPARPDVTAPAGTPVVPARDLVSGEQSPLGTPALPLTAAMAAVVKPADQALNLKELDASFNPLKEFTGPLTAGSQIFEGKAVIPTRDIIGGVIKSLGPQGAALAGLLSTLPEGSVIRTPAHQFNVDGQIGNRVIAYGGGIQHQNIDTLVTELGKQGFRVIKQMSHYNGPAQGGKAGSILEDGVGGTTHAGGFSAGFVDGKPASIKSDWPSDYGRLADANVDYNATLFAIDYQGGTKKPIPSATKLAYKHNADMWDAVLGALVPFAGSDPDSRFSNYKYNPLDLYDQASAVSIAKDAATLDWDQFRENHGAFYCAEGQYTVANLGPQEMTLLQKSKFGNTKLGALIEEFQKAPGYAGQDAEFRRTHPEIGWKHLRDTNGPDGKPYLDGMAYMRLEQTDRIGTALEWVPEDVKGWQTYEPIEASGLVAKPMTVAGLAWSVLSRYMPREAVSKQLAQDLVAGHAKGTPEQKKQIEMLLGGNAPSSAAGQKAIGVLAFKAATGFTSSILANNDFKQHLFEQAGAKEMLEPTAEEAAEGYKGRAALDDLYNRFVVGFQTARNEAELNAHLTALDDEMRSLKVIRAGRDDANPRKNAIKSLMLYAAPQSYSAWAQHEVFSGGTDVFRYVTQAMHEEQFKK